MIIIPKKGACATSWKIIPNKSPNRLVKQQISFQMRNGGSLLFLDKNKQMVCPLSLENLTLEKSDIFYVEQKGQAISEADCVYQKGDKKTAMKAFDYYSFKRFLLSSARLKKDFYNPTNRQKLDNHSILVRMIKKNNYFPSILSSTWPNKIRQRALDEQNKVDWNGIFHFLQANAGEIAIKFILSLVAFFPLILAFCFPTPQENSRLLRR